MHEAMKILGLGRPSKEQPERIGEVQVNVLLIINQSPERAYGVAIANQMREQCAPEISDAQVYGALRRLEARGFLKSCERLEMPKHSNSPSPKHQGRPRKYYTLTASGLRAMRTGVAQKLDAESGASMVKGLLHAATQKPSSHLG